MGEFAIYVTTRIPTLFKNNSNYGFQILFSNNTFSKLMLDSQWNNSFDNFVHLNKIVL